MNSTKGYPYYSRLNPIFNKEPLYLERDQHKFFQYQYLNRWKNQMEKQYTNQYTISNR